MPNWVPLPLKLAWGCIGCVGGDRLIHPTFFLGGGSLRRCTKQGCLKEHHAAGLCAIHYQALRKANEPKEKRKQYYRRDSVRFSQAKKEAFRRGFSWEISKEYWKQLISTNSCHYCLNVLPETGCGLDRKDTKLGYIESNVVPCCTRCNRVKHIYIDYETMLEVGRLLRLQDLKSLLAA